MVKTIRALLVLLALSAAGGCATPGPGNHDIVDQINIACARIEGHVVDANPDGSCVICAAPGKSVMACTAE